MLFPCGVSTAIFSNLTVFLFSSRILSDWLFSVRIGESVIHLLVFIRHKIEYYYVPHIVLSTKERRKADFQLAGVMSMLFVKILPE